ncbi:iron ABC transporter permease [Rhizobiaceae bacterium BDR2-2]|uniref:Iron ABC transporter permease n=1 Tax=Ectorhizobium quercum TaxID=2965071 RepID=A0AAE3MXK8_9HYPH|nr:iron ABC transporter permease [Ectorhizobium quercum]MCX8995535.1 iron ABC transporter permease [Ectorhizobium quercum]
MTDLAMANGYGRLALGPLRWRFHRRRLALCLLLALLVLAAAFAGLATGSGKAGLADLLAFLSGTADMTGGGLSVVGDLRLPRVLLALACGAMLGLAGAALQTLTRNGLADPGLLGVREGASLAVITLIIALPAAPLYLRPFAGMAGGLAVALAAVAIARSLSRLRFVLVGIGLSWLLSAAISMILVTAEVDRVQTAMVWMAGSLATASPDMLPLAFACLAVGGGVLALTARAADTGLLGDAAARGLGVKTGQLTALRIAAPVLLTAAAVSCAGGLGFVGLVAPHLTRLAFGGGQATLLTGSALSGAGLVLAADTLGRTLFAPLQIPAGIVLAVIGVPVLLALLWRRRNQF